MGIHCTIMVPVISEEYLSRVLVEGHKMNANRHITYQTCDKPFRSWLGVCQYFCWKLGGAFNLHM